MRFFLCFDPTFKLVLMRIFWSNPPPLSPTNHKHTNCLHPWLDKRVTMPAKRPPFTEPRVDTLNSNLSMANRSAPAAVLKISRTVEHRDSKTPTSRSLFSEFEEVNEFDDFPQCFRDALSDAYSENESQGTISKVPGLINTIHRLDGLQLRPIYQSIPGSYRSEAAG